MTHDSDVLARLTRIEDKIDGVKDAHADLRVHVERKSAVYGGITGLLTAIAAMIAGHPR